MTTIISTTDSKAKFEMNSEGALFFFQTDKLTGNFMGADFIAYALEAETEFSFFKGVLKIQIPLNSFDFISLLHNRYELCDGQQYEKLFQHFQENSK